MCLSSLSFLEITIQQHMSCPSISYNLSTNLPKCSLSILACRGYVEIPKFVLSLPHVPANVIHVKTCISSYTSKTDYFCSGLLLSGNVAVLLLLCLFVFLCFNLASRESSSAAAQPSCSLGLVTCVKFLYFYVHQAKMLQKS